MSRGARGRMWWWVALASMVMVAGFARAQESAAPGAAAGDSLGGLASAAASGAASGAQIARADSTRDRPPYVMPPLGQALFDHLHNKLVHFPIVVTLVATLLLVLARRRPDLEPLAFWLVWAAALSTLAAYFSGQAQQKEFEHGPKAWLVMVHRNQGITVGIAQALWVLSLLRERTRRRAWLLGLVLSFLVLTSGFLGGLIAHGE